MKNLLCLLLLTSSLQAVALTGLKVGAKAPKLSLKNTEGKLVDVTGKEKTTVLVFYRGSWCPYCITQLKTLNTEVEPKMKSLNSKLVVISVDKMKVAKKMKGKNAFGFDVIPDPKAKSLKAYNIINQLEPELVKKYKESYKIDVEGDSGEKHHMVAHPAVYIVKDGKVVFADIQINYKKRTKNSDILAFLNK